MRLYRLLLRLLPRVFRERHGQVMEEAFATALAAARRGGRAAVLALWWRETMDMVCTGARLRWGRRRTWTDSPGGGMGRTGGWGSLAGTLDDLRHALRTLTRRPGFTAFAAFTIGLGVGATTAVYSTMDSVTLRPLRFPGGDRVVTLHARIGSSGFITPASEQAEAWREGIADLVEATETVEQSGATLTGEGEPRVIQVARIDPSFHDFVAAPPVLGRRFTAEEAATGERVVLLGEELWRGLFGGDRAVLGRRVTLDGEGWAVVGIVPRRTLLPNGIPTRIDAWRPFPLDRKDRGSSLVARLREGVTPEQVTERLGVINARLQEEGRSSQSRPGVARPVTELLGRSLRDTLEVLMASVLLLLLIAVVNVANLLLARAAGRRQETAVRAALGASRGRLARQLLVESLLLALAGGVLGIGLAYGAVSVMAAVRPDELQALERVHVDGRVLLFALAVAVATGLAFGIVPAWGGSRAGLREALGSGARTDGGGLPGRRIRWALVAGQVALSFALLTGSALLVDALLRMQRRDPGFRTEGLLVAEVRLPGWKYAEPAEREEVLDRIAARLSALPGVEAVARASGLPPRAGILFGQVRVEGEAPTEETHVFHGPGVGADYFRVAGQAIIEGRGFTPEEVRDGADVFVIGEEAARRFFPGRSAVGARVSIGSPDGSFSTVVGVARDVAVRGLASTDASLQLYAPLEGGWGGRSFLIRTTPEGTPSLQTIRGLILSEEPEAILDQLASADRMFAETLARERFATAVLSLFGTLALALSAIGLYGVVSQVVGQRSREIGIRVSLGAHARDIRRMVVAGGVRATAAGILLGVALAAAAGKLLSSRLFGLEEARPAVYLVAATVLGFTALLASWMPAQRALRVDPCEVLREE